MASNPAAKPLTATGAAVLHWIGDPTVRVATTHQLLARYWIARGKSVRHGRRLLAELVAGAWLESRRLDPEQGRASRSVLALSARSRRLGLARNCTYPDPFLGLKDMLEWRLQHTQLLIEREPFGWVFVPRPAVPALLKTAAVAGWRGRRPFGMEEEWRNGCVRWTPVLVPVDAIRHTRTGEVRLVLPVRPGVDFRQLLRRLPRTALALLSTGVTIGVELVGAEPSAVTLAEEQLRSWAARKPGKWGLKAVKKGVAASGNDPVLRVVIHQPTHFREIWTPEYIERPAGSVYKAHGVKSPFRVR